MEDATERLIRRALGRQPLPRLGPGFADDVLRRVAAEERPAVLPGRSRARLWTSAASWLLTGGASIVVLVNLEWSSAVRAVAWTLALAAVPLAYSATLWPGRILGVLAPCGGATDGGPRRDGADGTPRGRGA